MIASLDNTESFHILQTIHLFPHIKFCINFTHIFLLDIFIKRNWSHKSQSDLNSFPKPKFQKHIKYFIYYSFIYIFFFGICKFHTWGRYVNLLTMILSMIFCCTYISSKQKNHWKGCSTYIVETTVQCINNYLIYMHLFLLLCVMESIFQLLV